MVPWEGLSGAGGPGSTDRKKKTLAFFNLVFLVLNFFFKYFYTGVQWFILRKTLIFKAPHGVQHFPGGGGG